MSCGDSSTGMTKEVTRKGMDDEEDEVAKMTKTRWMTTEMKI